jgi:hypothetical protein
MFNQELYGTTWQASRAGVPGDPWINWMVGTKLPLNPTCGKDIERPE